MNIEKNIPISIISEPSPLVKELLSIIDALEIGDSSVIPSKRRAYIQALAKGRGKKIMTRYLKDQHGFVRVWRLG